MPDNNLELAELIKTTANNKNLLKSEYLDFIGILSHYFKTLELIDVEINYSNDEHLHFERASLLHIAAFYNNAVLMGYLLQAKKCVNIDASCSYKVTHKNGRSLSSGGNTPLHIAARFNAPAAMEKLIECNANELLENDDHSTAIELAKPENIKYFSLKNIKDYKAKIDQQFDLYDKLAISRFFLGLATVAVPIIMLNILFPPVALVSAIGLIATVCLLSVLYICSTALVAIVFADSSMNKADALSDLSDSLDASIANKDQKPLEVKKQENHILDFSMSSLGHSYANPVVTNIFVDSKGSQLPTYEQACQSTQTVKNNAIIPPKYSPPSYEGSCREFRHA